MDTWIVLLKDFFEKRNFEESQQTTKSMKNYHICKELIIKAEFSEDKLCLYNCKLSPQASLPNF